MELDPVASNQADGDPTEQTRSDSIESDPTVDEVAQVFDGKNELHVRVVHQSKLYTDDTGRFPTRARSGNQYVMVAYHSSNAILVAPFKSRKDKHRLPAYNSIMQRLKDKGLTTDLQILDNEASKDYKALIRDKWGADFQLVPPHIHRQNAAERVIRTFKAHFLAILAGVASDFPRHLWDLLLPQVEMALNFLRQATINPSISAWEYLNGPFNYDATPLGPLGIKVLIHKKASDRHSWDFRAKEGWSVGVTLEHYRCQRVIPKDTKSEMVSDTVEFRHHDLTQPSVTPDDRLLHGLQLLTAALEGKPTSTSAEQLEAIAMLQKALGQWENTTPEQPPTRRTLASKKPRRTLIRKVERPSPRVERPAPRVQRPSPRVEMPSHNNQPIAQRTRSKQAVDTTAPDAIEPEIPDMISNDVPVAHRTRSRQALSATKLLALPVLDSETGQTMEYSQLRRHPKYSKIWQTSYSNELGCLCQGIGSGKKGPKQQRVK